MSVEIYIIRQLAKISLLPPQRQTLCFLPFSPGTPPFSLSRYARRTNDERSSSFLYVQEGSAKMTLLDEEITRLFRIHKTVMQMLRDRGYLVRDFEIELSRADFIGRYGEHMKREDLVIEGKDQWQL